MKENKKRRGGLLLVLPILALPFLTFAFWVLGGGRSSGENTERDTGINVELPDAKPGDDSALDKMAFYEQAEKAAKGNGADSLDGRADSLDGILETNSLGSGQVSSPNYTGTESESYQSSQSITWQTENRMRQRMQELQQQLDVQAEEDYPGQEFQPTSRPRSLQANGNTNPGVSSQTNFASDTMDVEMEQLQSMMNRIYDIQHPDEVTNRLKVLSEKNKGILYPVTTAKPESTVRLLSAGSTDSKDTIISAIPIVGPFYGLSASEPADRIADKGIWSVSQQDQVLVNGASIKLRLQQNVYVNGLMVPKGTLVTGQVQLNNDRLQVEVMSLLSGQNLLQVKLVAYDTDGMEGLSIPGSINRDVVRQSSDNSLQSIGVGTLDPSVGAQAAAAGIETAKTLFSRKLKLTKVFVKTGYRVLLKNQ